MDNIAPHVPKEGRIYRVTTWLTLFVLLGLVIVFAFREIYSPDLGFHLRAGEWILQNHSIPAYDTFTYTSDTRDYVDMHWLYQVTIALIYAISGEFGLVASHAALITLSFLLLFLRVSRRKNNSDREHWQWIFFFAVTSTAVLFEPRPHVLSWVFFNVLLLILEEVDEKRGGPLFLLPIVMLLWTNTHTLFIVGWVVIACYVIGFAFRDKKIWTPLTRYGIASLAISFLNPYGVKGVALPFVQFQLLQPHNVFKDAIAELTSPMSFESYFFNGHFLFLQPLLWFHLFLLVSVLSFIGRLKRIQLHEFLIFGLFLYLAVSGIRNISFFIFAVVPATISGLTRPHPPRGGGGEQTGPPSFMVRIRDYAGSFRGQTVLNVLTSVVSVILIIAVMTDVYYISYRSNDRFGYRFNNHVLPERAAAFLVGHRLEGKILNHFNFGGYLIWAVPQKVFIDGRTEVIGEEFFYGYSILWNQIDKRPILEKYNPEIVIFPHQNEFLWVHYFRKDTMWRLVYADELAAIYLRNGYADHIPPLGEDRSLSGYQKLTPSEMDNIIKKEDPPGVSLLSLRKQYFPVTELGLSTFYYYNDQYDEAIKVAVNGLMRSTSPCPEMYYNLGHYFFETREFERSAYCYERFLRTNSDGLARERLTMIRSGQIRLWQDK